MTTGAPMTSPTPTPAATSIDEQRAMFDQFREEQRLENERYRNELRKEYERKEALRAAEQNPQPQLPTVQELDLPDVLRILIQHARIPLESQSLAMLAAVDRAFAEDETTDDTAVDG